MKKVCTLAFALLVLGVASAQAQTIRPGMIKKPAQDVSSMPLPPPPPPPQGAALIIHVMDQFGNPLDQWLADQSTMSLGQFQPQWNGSWHWSEVGGDYRCNVQDPNSAPPPPVPGPVPGSKKPQGCIENGEAVISQDGTGNDLQLDHSYLLKLDVPGYLEGRAEWIYLWGEVDVYIVLQPSPMEVSIYTWKDDYTGRTHALYYVFNYGPTPIHVNLETMGVFAGVTSKSWTAQGGRYSLTVPANDSRYIYEEWTMPTTAHGQTFGEDDCLRGQARTFIPGGLLVREGSVCNPNYQ